jgi:predicted O-methyltransferase YrrM
MEPHEPVPRHAPESLRSLLEATERLGFSMASEPAIGSLLRTLVASRPGGAHLELGTGTGLASAWMLDGMDPASTLLSVELDPEPLALAERYLGADPRVTFLCADGGDFLVDADPESFDLIFADAWPGKFTHLDEAIRVLRTGGLYVIDDLLPQPDWPDDHPPKVARLLAQVTARNDLRITYFAWSSGVIIAAKVSR